MARFKSWPETYIYGVYTVFSTEKSPNIRSYTVYIYGSGQTYTLPPTEAPSSCTEPYGAASPVAAASAARARSTAYTAYTPLFLATPASCRTVPPATYPTETAGPSPAAAAAAAVECR